MLEHILKEAVRQNASDVHIKAGGVPVFRINGVLNRQNLPAVSENAITSFIEQYGTCTVNKTEADFCCRIDGAGSFRVHGYLQNSFPALAVRIIKSAVPALSDLNAPPVLEKLAMQRSGLILVTGPAGSGKSTTLTAMVDFINRNKSAHIVTLEDPPEYRFTEDKSIISQRQVGSDTASFALGLRAALRQDPDVIMIGELRDAQTAAGAVSAAETGHLVLATLHTRSAVLAVSRMLDFFAPEKQQQMRAQLAENLQCVIAQQLVPGCHGGRTAAFEVLTFTQAVRSLLRDGKAHQFASYMQSGRQQGMQCMDYALAYLAKTGEITKQTAQEYAFDIDLLNKYLLQ